MIHASHASFQTKTDVFAWLKTTEACMKATVDFFSSLFFFYDLHTHFLNVVAIVNTYFDPLYFIVHKNFNYHDYQQPAAKRQVKFATRHLFAQSLLPSEL